MSTDTALILAAGQGSRLRDVSRTLALTKPEAQVLGVSLAERVLRTLAQALSPRRVVVVVGHQAERVQAHFSELAERLGVSIDFVRADHWQLGNGASALAARGRLPERFLLTMVDHVFSPQAVHRLLAAPLDGGVNLAVDRDRAGLFDVDDATKVCLDGDRIVAAGKALERWDAVDTGLFHCTAALFEGIESAAAAGKHGLTDGLVALAGQGRAGAVDVTGCWWLDVDTPAALHHAETRLLADAAAKAHDGPVARHLNRRLSSAVTRYLARTPLTPNQISAGVFALSALAAFVLAQPGYAALAVGGLLVQIASVLDGCDGEIARLKFLGSEFGGWFDAVLDRYADALILLGLMLHAMTGHDAAAVTVAGFAALTGSFLVSYTADKHDNVLARRGGVRLRIGRDLRLLLVCLGALANAPLATLWLIAGIMNIEVVRRVAAFRLMVGAVTCRRAGRPPAQQEPLV